MLLAAGEALLAKVISENGYAPVGDALVRVAERHMLEQVRKTNRLSHTRAFGANRTRPLVEIAFHFHTILRHCSAPFINAVRASMTV